MASVFKPKGKSKYVIFYVDEHGRRRKKVGTTDKGVTQRIARELENRVVLRREGLINPLAESRANQELRLLPAHLEDFHKALQAKGTTEKHAGQVLVQARRIAEAAKLERLSDLVPSRVQVALADLRASGKSLATCNHHRAAIRSFSRWLWKEGRLASDPLVGVTGFNAKEDRRHDRRTLGLEELRALIHAAESGSPYGRMSGPARALCYRLAVSSGLRLSELRSLYPDSFDGSSVTVKAGYAKNGQTATIPLPPDVAQDLAEWLDGRPASEPIFPLPRGGADMLKVDLESAAIPYRDASGLVFDFHALRCQTATLADQAGCSPRVIQRLMRHSTLELTGRYTRPRAADLEHAVSVLPALSQRDTHRDELMATGTDGLAPSATQCATLAVGERHNTLIEQAVASPTSPNTNPKRKRGRARNEASRCEKTRFFTPNAREVARIRV